MTKPSLLTCCSAFAVDALGDDGAPRKVVQLIPMGTSRPRNGNPSKIILEGLDHAEQVVAASAQHHSGADVVVDFDHQTVRAPAVAGQAPAAGWMKRIFADEKLGICAEVDWTEEAAADLRAKKYRFISPYFGHTAEGRVTRIINAGLTNTPNLDLLAVASAISTEEEVHDMKAIATALGLQDSASEAAIIAAIDGLKGKATAFAATASALGIDLKDDTELTSVASAAQELKDAKPGDPDPAKFVPIESLNELKTSMSSMQERLDAGDVKERGAMLDQAQREGRVTPAQRKYAEDNIKETTALASYLAAQPPSSLGRKVLTDENPAGDVTALTEEQKSLCSAMGWDEDAYLKQLKEEAA